MKKIQMFGSLFLAMLGCFTIGLYASSTFMYNEPIALYRWLITSFFNVMFLMSFLKEYANYCKKQAKYEH